MIQAAAAQGWIDGVRVMEEALLSIKRAGACGILSYASLEMAHHLNRKQTSC
jgi:porphobilinogen synthase